jgi:hypothetical protein
MIWRFTPLYEDPEYYEDTEDWEDMEDEEEYDLPPHSD